MLARVVHIAGVVVGVGQTQGVRTVDLNLIGIVGAPSDLLAAGHRGEVGLAGGVAAVGDINGAFVRYSFPAVKDFVPGFDFKELAEPVFIIIFAAVNRLLVGALYSIAGGFSGCSLRVWAMEETKPLPFQVYRAT